MKIVFEQIGEPSTENWKHVGRRSREELFVVEVNNFPAPLSKGMCFWFDLLISKNAKQLSGPILNDESYCGIFVVDDVRWEIGDDDEIIQTAWIYFEG